MSSCGTAQRTTADGTATIENGTAPVATDGTEDYGPVLQIWDPVTNGGTGAWVNYTAGNAYTLLAATTYVRTAINPDTVFEGQHNFFLGVTRKGAGDIQYGTGNIYDDGTGVKYDGTITGGSPTTDTTSLDDDRSISVNGPTVNEASDYVVFTVTGNSGQTASLRIVEETGQTGFHFVDEAAPPKALKALAEELLRRQLRGHLGVEAVLHLGLGDEMLDVGMSGVDSELRRDAMVLAMLKKARKILN